MGYARGILLAPVVLGILAPLFLKLQMYWASENTYHFLSAICHQASSRSFWIVGAPLGICARDVGIYIGLFGASYGSILKNRKWIDKTVISILFLFPLVIEKTVLREIRGQVLREIRGQVLHYYSLGFLRTKKCLIARPDPMTPLAMNRVIIATAFGCLKAR